MAAQLYETYLTEIVRSILMAPTYGQLENVVLIELLVRSQISKGDWVEANPIAFASIESNASHAHGVPIFRRWLG